MKEHDDDIMDITDASEGKLAEAEQLGIELGDHQTYVDPHMNCEEKADA